MYVRISLILLFCIVTDCYAKNDHLGKDYWMKMGKLEIKKALHRYAKLRQQSVESAMENTKFPKNLIIFIGDGMSISTVTAARILKNQKMENISDVDDEEQELTWENFPEMALMKTYNTNKQTGDSAATAVSMFTGVKTTHRTLGFDNKIEYKKPSTEETAQKLTGILDWAQEANMKTGFVTNTRLTHATPAALYAHSANRNWECDAAINNYTVSPDEISLKDQVVDIAKQMIQTKPGNATDVIFGGGYLAFNAVGKPDNEWDCIRKDGLNLIQQWKNQHISSNTSHNFVSNLQELKQLMQDHQVEQSSNSSTKGLLPEKILGIFGNGHLSYEYEKPNTQPTLSEMTQAAIELLHANAVRDDEEKGFFLMVEGGRIDHAHHRTFANIALDETLALDKAVQTAMETLKSHFLDEETLVIVTADHSHTMVLPGYTGRDTPFPGFLGDNEIDHKKETSIVYANGPGAKENSYELDSDGQCSRVDPGNHNVTEMTYQYPALVHKREETHASDDVGLWASGPLAFMFHSTHEQSYIGHVLAFSLCIGHFQNDTLCCHQNQPRARKVIKAGNDFNILEFSLIGIALIFIIISGLLLLSYIKRKARHSENQSVESGNTPSPTISN